MDFEAVEARIAEKTLARDIDALIHPSYHVDMNYVKAIEMIAEHEKVVFPMVCIADMCMMEFEGKFMSEAYGETIFCATSRPGWFFDNHARHKKNEYYCDGSVILQIYINCLTRPYRDRANQYGGGWVWRIMIENQGCCDWVVSYTGAYDPAPVVWQVIQECDKDDKILRCDGAWESVKERRFSGAYEYE